MAYHKSPLAPFILFLATNNFTSNLKKFTTVLVRSSSHMEYFIYGQKNKLTNDDSSVVIDATAGSYPKEIKIINNKGQLI